MIIREQYVHMLGSLPTNIQNDELGYIHKYLRRGGKLSRTRIPFRVDLECIPDLLKSSEPWLVKDLSSFQICLIGAIAHVDAVLGDRIKKTLASYRSPIPSSRESFAINLFESLFSVASIKSKFCALEHGQKYAFMSLLCKKGSASMVKLFLDVGLDLNGAWQYSDPLGSAAAEGNIVVVDMLLGAGAESSSALKRFLEESDHLPNGIFSRILWTLVGNARPATFDRTKDPLISIMRSSRAFSLHPKAPEILLNRKIFTDISLGRGAAQSSYHDSYMCYAITQGQHSVVDLLLQNGAIADATISDLFDCHEQWLEPCTWITFSIHCGAAACADVLIRHGADFTARDRSGKSAIQLAQMNVLASHPRYLPWLSLVGCSRVTAEQDTETLTVVERAFNDRFQGTKSLEDHTASINELPFRPHPRRKRLNSIFRKITGKALGKFLTTSQTEVLHKRLEDLYRDIPIAWSLSFYEALLIRFFYILSHALLLGLEIRAIINGQRRIRMPSRSHLSAVAFFTLVIIWCSSHFGFSWGSSAAGSKSETNS